MRWCPYCHAYTARRLALCAGCRALITPLDASHAWRALRRAARTRRRSTRTLAVPAARLLLLALLVLVLAAGPDLAAALAGLGPLLARSAP